MQLNTQVPVYLAQHVKKQAKKEGMTQKSFLAKMIREDMKRVKK